MIVAGRVSQKMGPVLRQIYDQMPEPKWVISMGACASTGGMFNNYAIIQGVDKVVPVDVYLPGLPPSSRGAPRRSPQAADEDRRRAARLAPGLGGDQHRSSRRFGASGAGTSRRRRARSASSPTRSCAWRSRRAR